MIALYDPCGGTVGDSYTSGHDVTDLLNHHGEGLHHSICRLHSKTRMDARSGTMKMLSFWSKLFLLFVAFGMLFRGA
jgi:hypothetical protein